MNVKNVENWQELLLQDNVDFVDITGIIKLQENSD